MATTENLFTGDGSTVLFNFTFPYIDETDVYVSLDGTATTAYSYANATTLQFTTAPTSGVAIRIFRSTSSADTKAAFFAGSAIRSKDLNDNFVQSLYIAQESENLADAAKVQAATAEASAATANTNATAAAASAATATQQATASAASSASALAASQQASTDAAAAQASATAAQTSATAAAANAAQSATDSASAITTAQGAVTTANASSTLATTADGNATTSLNRVNTYLHDGTNPVGDGVGSNPQGLAYAINTSNTSASSAASAVSTASNAASTANTAATTASSALSIANAASAAVSQAVLFTLVANVAAIPGSPSNNDYIEVGDSTGIQSFSPLSSIPSGFVGASGLTARIRYDSTASSWVFMSYFANNPEDRYLTKNLPVVTGDSTNGSGQITLNCENNSHGIKIKGPPHSAAASYTLTLPNNTGTSGQALTTNGSGVLSFADIASSIITQTDFAYTPTSNSLTFNDGLSSTPGSTSSEFSFFTNANTGNFSFMPTNASIKSNMEALQVGDSVTLDWTLPNGTTASQTTTVTTRTAQPIPSGSYGTVVFANAGTYHSSSAATVKLTCSRISNGVEPIANNQVLRYKTATNKWTVDTAEVIAICDGGNFATGASLVQTSTTFDGGSF